VILELHGFSIKLMMVSIFEARVEINIQCLVLLHICSQACRRVDKSITYLGSMHASEESKITVSGNPEPADRLIVFRHVEPLVPTTFIINPRHLPAE